MPNDFPKITLVSLSGFQIGPEAPGTGVAEFTSVMIKNLRFEREQFGIESIPDFLVLIKKEIRQMMDIITVISEYGDTAGNPKIVDRRFQ